MREVPQAETVVEAGAKGAMGQHGINRYGAPACDRDDQVISKKLGNSRSYILRRLVRGLERIWRL